MNLLKHIETHMGAVEKPLFAITITAVAYLIPFGILFVVVVWLLAKLWRRLRRPKAVT